MYLGLLRGRQGLAERVVLLLGHGTVDIVRRAPVVTGAQPREIHVHALGGDQRRGRVIKGQRGSVA